MIHAKAKQADLFISIKCRMLWRQKRNLTSASNEKKKTSKSFIETDTGMGYFCPVLKHNLQTIGGRRTGELAYNSI